MLLVHFFVFVGYFYSIQHIVYWRLKIPLSKTENVPYFAIFGFFAIAIFFIFQILQKEKSGFSRFPYVIFMFYIVFYCYISYFQY